MGTTKGWSRGVGTPAAVVLAALAVPYGAAGQLAERVARVDAGEIRFSYQTREGIEICDEGVRRDGRQMSWRGDGREEPPNCRSGVAEVEVRMRDGLVRDVDIVLSASKRSETAEELGPVSAEEASRFLLSLARAGATGRGRSEAVFAATLADVEVWRELIVLARARDLPNEVRETALFWVGQEAGAATQGLADVAADEQEDQDIRNAAVFALSQRPADEGVDALMELARSANEPETRRTAMFWLAQSRDERVVQFFEEILLGSPR